MRLRTAGFTLVELVIAFVLLAIGIVAILELVGQSALNARLARNRTQAALLAQQRMEELLSQPDLQPGISEGNFGDRFPQFRWRAQIEQVSGSADPAQAPLYRLTVVVEWQEGTRTQSVQLDTLWTPVPLTPPVATSGMGALPPQRTGAPPSAPAIGGRTP
jgi:general secretion pathway protein I